ncbi:MAG: class II glutamine amidotransferase [Pseudomonadota bacterium]
MCRWMTYVGEKIFLDTLLYHPEHSLVRQSLHSDLGAIATNGDGFGIGWYGEREVPGTYHEVLPAWNDRNLRSLAHQLASPLFCAHVRASSGTATSRANCHPFAHRQWLYMHNGEISGYDRIRRTLEGMISDAHYALRRGTTDSEVFFLLLLGNGLEDDPAAATARTVADVLSVMSDHGVTDPFRMTSTLTDGRTVYALRYASDGVPPTLYWWPTETRLIVVSEPLDSVSEHWREVPPATMLISVGHGDGREVPFDPATAG